MVKLPSPKWKHWLKGGPNWNIGNKKVVENEIYADIFLNEDGPAHRPITVECSTSFAAQPQPPKAKQPYGLLSCQTKPKQSTRHIGEERERESVEASGRFSKMLSSLSAWLVNPRRNPLARLHMNAVASRLRKYGELPPPPPPFEFRR